MLPVAAPEPGRTTGIAAQVGPARAGAILRGSQVAMAFECVGDHWSTVVLREAFLGVRRFDELAHATGASRATLTARLRSLVEQGVLRRQLYQARPARHEYRLTAMGADLYPTALMYWLWEQNYGGGGSGLPTELIHRSCGHSMRPVLVCRECTLPIVINDIRVEVLADPDGQHLPQLPRHCLHTRASSSTRSGRKAVHVIDVIGDRWTALVQAATYYGLHRFGDIQSALEVPTNTLAHRLALLVQANVFARTQYHDHPPRYTYSLTEKGRALYLPAFTLHLWAERWLLRDRIAPLRLWHRACGQRVEGDAVCSHCRHGLQPADVEPRYAGGKRAR